MERLIEKIFMDMAPGKSAQSLNELTPHQRKKLFSLIPIETIIFESQIANAILFAKQRDELKKICSTSVYHHKTIGIPLPDPESIQAMSQSEISDLLNRLAFKVSQLVIPPTALSLSSKHPRTILNRVSSMNMLTLISSLSFVSSDQDVLFSNKDLIFKFLSDLLMQNTETLKQTLKATNTLIENPSEENAKPICKVAIVFFPFLPQNRLNNLKPPALRQRT